MIQFALIVFISFLRLAVFGNEPAALPTLAYIGSIVP